MARRRRGGTRREGAGVLERLIESIPPGPVAIDTAIVIYFAERNERYVNAVRPLFEAADREEVELVTSAVTLLEVLVVPFRVGDAPPTRFSSRPDCRSVVARF